MPAIILESGLGSQYEDAPDSYEFQSRYLKHFAPLAAGERLFAVIYEPRGEDKQRPGRMAYVGLAEIVSAPVATGRKNRAGEDLWRVHYNRPVVPFDVVVHREVGGMPVETWLREFPRGRSRNVATFGRAVRPLLDTDFERIMLLAGTSDLHWGSTYPVADEHVHGELAARERVTRLVTTIERRAAFRAEVIEAYDRRCAVTGLTLGPVATSKAHGLLDAAHIRPVGSDGTDSVDNGLAMTPTLHRLFDQGLFSFGADGDDLVVVTSPLLDRGMVEVPERGVALAISDGTRLLLPSAKQLRPRRQFVDYHRSKVFRAAG